MQIETLISQRTLRSIKFNPIQVNDADLFLMINVYLIKATHVSTAIFRLQQFLSRISK